MNEVFHYSGLIAFLILVGYVTKTWLDYNVRKRLIEKGAVDENIKHLYQNVESPGVLTSLKWGMILIAVGLGLLVGINVSIDYSDEITFAFMFIFAGVALLLYYFLADRIIKKSKKSE